MAGTILNVLGIVIGSIAGLSRKSPVSVATQGLLRLALGCGTVVAGLYLVWVNVGGGFRSVLVQLAVVIAAMMLGRLVGRLIRLQKLSNRLGQFAKKQMDAAQPGTPHRMSDGFNACAAVFCAAPLGILGATTDGFSNHWQPLAIKAVMDGMAAMGFVTMFGWGVMLSALPVLAFQGTIALVCRFALGPWLAGYDLVDPVNATAGMLMCAVALVILGTKKVELADYLPSLVMAPLLTWGLRLLT